jgi:hypothetical protein
MEDEMDGACIKYRTDEKYIQNITGKINEETMWKMYMGG